MTRVQIGLGQDLSDWLRRVVQSRSFSQRLSALRKLRPSDIRLFVPEVKNRVTGRSMGEHTEDMAKTWNIGRTEQDELALQSHRYAVAAQDRGFFADLIVPVDGVSTDHFPRRDTSLDKLSKLKPVFDRTSGKGTLTAGNSSPLTDGAAAIWVATEEGINRLPPATPRVRLVDFEMAAVDIFTEGLLMAPVSAIPRILARRSLKFDDITLWEIHEAFSAQVLCHIKGLEIKTLCGKRPEWSIPSGVSAGPHEPQRRQCCARSSLRCHRRTNFEPGRQGTCCDAQGKSGDRQYLCRRWVRDRSLAGKLIVKSRKRPEEVFDVFPAWHEMQKMRPRNRKNHFAGRRAINSA